MNIRIYSYKQIWYERMSEYIHKRKIDTNECPNIYSWPIYSIIRIYSSHSGLDMGGIFPWVPPYLILRRDDILLMETSICVDDHFTISKLCVREAPRKGRLNGQFWMNFRKTSKRLLTPPPALVSENNVAFFREVLKSATKFFGLEWPPLLFQKFIVFPLKITEKICNKIFWIGNDPPPPLEVFRKFIQIL